MHKDRYDRQCEFTGGEWVARDWDAVKGLDLGAKSPEFQKELQLQYCIWEGTSENNASGIALGRDSREPVNS